MGTGSRHDPNLDGGETLDIHKPISTYRLQLRSGLTLTEARELVDYFEELGVSDLYLSPILRAESDASHGYAVVDFDTLDPRVGTLDSLVELSESLRSRGMGLILDVVSNHMSASAEENPWWRDVLEMGPRSRYAHFFDIDWNSADPELQDRVLVPALVEPYAVALKRGLALERTMDGLFVNVSGRRLPLSPSTWSEVLSSAAREEAELRGLLAALEVLLEGVGAGPMSESQWREKERLKESVVALLTLSTALGELADRALEAISRSTEALGALLDQQRYRLSPWWDAASRINYRMFFDIAELAALRVEDPEVFRATHRFVLGLAEQGFVQGLRIDHIDGLLDPKGYLDALPKDLYVVVEKILDRSERLRPEWRTQGTTGYDALNQLERLFVRPSGEARLLGLFRELTGEDASFEDTAYRSRLELLETTFEGDLRSLAARLAPFVRALPGQATRSLEEVVDHLAKLVSSLAVYRTYLGPEDEEMDDWDRRVVESAASAASRRSPGADRALLDAIASILEGPASPAASASGEEGRRELTLRFQQLSSPVMAKGVEDTACYRHYALLSLNEVGGGPTDLTLALEEFHERNVERAERWPFGLVATSTHDTKRDEDVRARIDVLSEVPEEWSEAVERWMAWNERLKGRVGAGQAPDVSEEYLFYQTLIGSWPLEPLDASSHLDYVERLQGFMEKALREAKRHTSWTERDEAYEASVRSFVSGVLDPEESFRFLDDFARFERTTRRAGLLNALSRTLLKAAMPGVPDFYQGSELWRLGLVDPDNRRPVDFEAHREKLRHVNEEVAHRGAAAFLDAALETLTDGRLKLYVTRCLLQERRRRRELFAEGSYRSLPAEGARSERVVAFARERGGERLVAAAGRFFIGLPEPPLGETAWRDTLLAVPYEEGQVYREVLSGERVRVHRGGLRLAEVFRHAPLALLAPETGRAEERQ